MPLRNPAEEDLLKTIIPLHPDDAPHFTFSVPTLNQEAPRKRYYWKFLPQGMKNSPSVCQWVRVSGGKIQRIPPWKYLGLEIEKQTIVPQKLVVKNNIRTLADVQQLCGSLNWCVNKTIFVPGGIVAGNSDMSLSWITVFQNQDRAAAVVDLVV
ncbi:hypothetical protein DUI87_01448 [Hirundo rustica rustica]|uniref:Uncharacterized protein n=1 Tax=Hirundo rustica rustica TaxID=333673 RepID=A0A3M0L6J5_HIRRU|nr:hypothetical protein DUI87_01448 [Hirundo rustica rustica]